MMMIKSENQLLSIDETCLSELSDENEATISGGFFLLGLLGGLFGGWGRGYSYSPAPAPAPSTGGYTIINNNYNTIYVNTGGSNSDSSSSAKR